MPNDDSISDPRAIVRGFSDEQLKEYERFYGEQSREWIIAQDARARRRYPPWARILRNLIALVVAAALAIKFFS
jgi:hypothetical protein